jgi:hypothetical protein
MSVRWNTDTDATNNSQLNPDRGTDKLNIPKLCAIEQRSHSQATTIAVAEDLPQRETFAHYLHFFRGIFMQFNRLVMPIFLLAPLSLGFTSAQAQVPSKSTTTTTTTVITTAVPAPKESVAEPEGYVRCTTVAAGWEAKTWHDAYQVCQYDTTNTTVQGEGWVAGHWQCSQYTVGADQSECTAWDWSEGHWVKNLAEMQ